MFAQLIQKWQIPNGLITPLMLCATQKVAIGDLYYSNGSVFIRLPIGTANQVLTVVNGLPIWKTPTPGFSGTITTAKLTSLGANGSMTFVDGVLTSEVAAT